MSDLSIEPIGSDDRARAYATLVLAFTNDPIERWLYPDAQQYLEHFPRFLEAFGGRAFDEGTVRGLSDLSGVAFWLAPGVEPDDDAIVSVLTDSVEVAKHDDMFAVLEQMDAVHPTEPHWYLPWFGVDSLRQGQGLGSHLMTPCLEIVDASGMPAYLEAPNPRSIPFYQRHGFEVTGQAEAGTCPPLTLMSRAAR